MQQIPDSQDLDDGSPYRPTRSTLRLGWIADTAGWQAVQKEYYWDRVEVAYQAALEVGDQYGGATLAFFRVIEGEFLTRQASRIERIDEKLQLEAEHLSDGLKADVRGISRAVAARLGWSFEADVMVSVLVAEADNPWHGARYGYYMDKYPYGKVCIPGAVVSHSDEFRRVLSHEYAHVITYNLTNNRAPHWVEEGISRTMEGPVVDTEWKHFTDDPSQWRDLQSLEGAFGKERREGANQEAVSAAYAQAHLLVDALHKQKGDQGLADFLRAYGDNSAWEEIKIATSLDNPTDEALRQVYGLNQHKLFDSVHKSLFG